MTSLDLPILPQINELSRLLGAMQSDRADCAICRDGDPCWFCKPLAPKDAA